MNETSEPIESDKSEVGADEDRSPLPVGSIEKPQYGDLVVACVICKEKRPVLLYPHRLDGNVVGWVFVCASDQEVIQGADVRIQIDMALRPRHVHLGSTQHDA